MSTQRPFFVRRRWVEELLLQRSSRTGDRLARSLEDATIDLLPHQVEAAAFALNRLFSGGAILADEVGLGKTIEAGLVISQLWAEKQRKILIIVPAGLRRQWVEELNEHFHLQAHIIERSKWKQIVAQGPEGLLSLCERGPLVLSYAFAYREVDALAEISWDLIVFDEAHRLRNVYRPENRMGRTLRAAFEDRNKLLLSATPLQNSLLELFGLFSFVDDRLLGTQYSFMETYVADSRGWEVTNSEELSQKISSAMIRTLRRQVADTIRFTSRHSSLHTFTPFDEEKELYQRVSAFLCRTRSAAIGSGQQPLMRLLYRKILASSSFAIAQTLLRLIKRLREHLDGREEAAPSNEWADIETFEEEEDLLESAAERAVESLGRSRLDEFSREEIEAEMGELTECYGLASRIERNAKGEALVQALAAVFKQARENGFPEKALIFTESRRTQRYLYERLRAAGYENDMVLLSGDIADSAERHRVVERFRRDCRILVATDAGAEGLNLHFCSVVVNYDLPWNPQRVEQRIGRCHRYGQRHDVVVLNFLAEGNAADRRVYEVLSQKFRLFDGVFGTSDEPLGALENSVAFEQKVLEIYQSCRTPEAIDEAFERLHKELDRSLRGRLATARSLLVDRFDDEVQRRFRLIGQTVRNTLERGAWILRELVLGVFDHTPGERSGEYRLCISEEYLLSVPGIEPEMNVVFGTGLQGSDGGVHLSPGHPLVDQVLREIREHQPTLPPPLHLQLARDRSQAQRLSALIGTTGWWFLFKATVESLENEEHLVDVAIVEESGSPRILSQEDTEALWKIAEKSDPVRVAVPQPSRAIVDLAADVAQKRSAEIERTVKEWCESEIESRLEVLDAYVDSEVMQTQAEVEQMRERLSDLRARRRESHEPTARTKLRSQVSAQETRLLKAIQRINGQIESRITENRETRATLERRARTAARVEPILTARWKLVWE